MRLKMRFLPLLLASLTLSAYPAFSQSDGLATFTLPPEEGSLPAIPTSSSSSDGGSTPTGPGTIPPIITTPPSISDPFENGSSSSSDGSSSSSSSSNSTDSLSTSSSANVTATSTSSAATSTGTLLPDDGANFTDPSGDWGYSGEFVQPFIPPELEADGDLVELAYLASTDPSLCEAQASSLSSRKRQLIERALGYDDDEEERGARRLKKRALVDLCLPNEATIAVTFHWMVPSYRTINDYVNSTALDLQIEKMRRKFAPFRIKFNVQQRWIHSGSVAVNQYSLYDSAEAAANSATTIRLKNKVKGLASNYNPTAYDHLNIFLIDSYYKDGEFPNGFCTYPGKGKIKNEADGCAVLVNTLPGHKDYAYRSSKPPSNLAAEWQGSTMVHEIGHWLDLKHLFDDDKGCAGDDGLAATPQYPTGSSATMQIACGDKVKTSVTNFMTPSHGRNTFHPAQLARMHKSLQVYRRGAKQYTCTNQIRRSEPLPTSSWLDGLKKRFLPSGHTDHEKRTNRNFKRQTPASICQSAQNLRINSVELSSFGQSGLFSADSPEIQGGPAPIPPNFDTAEPAAPQGGDGGQVGAGKDLQDYLGDEEGSSNTSSSSSSASAFEFLKGLQPYTVHLSLISTLFLLAL